MAAAPSLIMVTDLISLTLILLNVPPSDITPSITNKGSPRLLICILAADPGTPDACRYVKPAALPTNAPAVVVDVVRERSSALIVLTAAAILPFFWVTYPTTITSFRLLDASSSDTSSKSPVFGN